MALNLPIMVAERGFSKAMAFPHLLLWPWLVAVDAVSLVLDARDAVLWWRGAREVAGPGGAAGG